MQSSKSQKQVWNNIASEWHEFKTSSGKARGVEEFLNKQYGNILDLGSGSGRNLQKIKNGKIFLIDFSEKMIRLAKQKAKKENIDAEFKVSDISKIPYKDNFFDAGICIASIHCLETFQKREKTIKELYRVLKAQAQVLVAVWNIDSKRFKNSPKEKCISWRNKGKRFYYLFDKEEIYNLFKKAGFKIKQEIESDVNITFIAEK